MTKSSILRCIIQEEAIIFNSIHSIILKLALCLSLVGQQINGLITEVILVLILTIFASLCVLYLCHAPLVSGLGELPISW